MSSVESHSQRLEYAYAVAFGEHGTSELREEWYRLYAEAREKHNVGLIGPPITFTWTIEEKRDG